MCIYLGDGVLVWDGGVREGVVRGVVGVEKAGEGGGGGGCVCG